LLRQIEDQLARAETHATLAQAEANQRAAFVENGAPVGIKAETA